MHLDINLPREKNLDWNQRGNRETFASIYFDHPLFAVLRLGVLSLGLVGHVKVDAFVPQTCDVNLRKVGQLE